MKPRAPRRRARPAGPRGRPAFTLVEILIVVVILGILAAIVVPQFVGATEESRRGSFVTTLQHLADAVEIESIRSGGFVADAGSGTFPPELAGSIRQGDWESPTPLGGVWDVETNDSGVTHAVGVHFDAGDDPGVAEMNLVDALIDDGDVTTGIFRQIAGSRYYLVLAE